MAKSDHWNVPPAKPSPFSKMPPIRVASAGVSKLLGQSNQKKACGNDNIPAVFLKHCTEEPSPMLSFIIQQSLDTKTVHRENNPVTQTIPEPTLLSWGGWPRETPPPPPHPPTPSPPTPSPPTPTPHPPHPPTPHPHPWPHGKPGLIALIWPLRPYCSQALWSCSGMSRK